MQGTVAKWGNCNAVRLPAAVAKTLGLTPGTAIEMKLVDGALMIKAVAPRTYMLEELVAGITDDNHPDDTFPTQDIGAEIVTW